MLIAAIWAILMLYMNLYVMEKVHQTLAEFHTDFNTWMSMFNDELDDEE